LQRSAQRHLCSLAHRHVNPQVSSSLSASGSHQAWMFMMS
jgi:hypothetical protein